MGYHELLELVFEVAKEHARRGAGWSQQKAILWEVANRLSDGMSDERLQQQILTCWHDLFRLGRLSWGFNIDNPDAPFYHIPAPDSERDELGKNTSMGPERPLREAQLEAEYLERIQGEDDCHDRFLQESSEPIRDHQAEPELPSRKRQLK